MRFRYLALLLFTFCLRAQQEQELPLKTILDRIAVQHQVQFSYIEQELVVYAMAPPPQRVPLNKKLAYIEARTLLRFREVAPTYFTVYNDRGMDKPLCGYLIDAGSGAGIENARLSITATQIVAFSGADGYFELPVLSANTIEIRHPGYRDRLLEPSTIYLADCPAIKLDADTQQLQPVLAQRYIATGIRRNDDGTLGVRPGKFGILPGLTEPDVLQAMQQIPGISSVSERVADLSIRGGTHDQNLFLWNGIRIFQTGHFFGQISAFNPMLATHVVISKNGSSALYGEGVSGTVDISSHTKKIDSCYNAASVDLINSNFFAKIKLSGRATIQAAGRRTFTDVFTSPTFRMYRDRIFRNTEVTDISSGNRQDITSGKNFYFYDFAMQYHQKISDRHQLILDGIGISNSLDYFQADASDTVNSELKQDNFGASLHWRADWNARHFTEFQAYLSRYQLVSGNQYQEHTEFSSDSRNRLLDAGFRLHHTFAVHERLKATIGYQFDGISIRDSGSQRRDSQSHALVTEANFTSADGQSTLRAGLRSNYYSLAGTLLLEPRLVFVRKFYDHWKLELLAQRKSQTLFQRVDFQQDFLGIETRRWVVADGDALPVEKGVQFSAGLVFEKSGWLVSVDNFYRQTDGISASTQDFRNQFKDAEASGKATVWGTEIFVQKDFGAFYGWVSYAYNDNRFDFGAFQPQRFDNNTAIRHAVSAAGVFEWQSVKLALGGKFRTGRVYTRLLSVVPGQDGTSAGLLYGAPNAARLPDYVQLNFSASRTWKLASKTDLVFSASLLNLLDRHNETNRYYRIDPLGGQAERVSEYALGLTPNIALAIRF